MLTSWLPCDNFGESLDKLVFIERNRRAVRLLAVIIIITQIHSYVTVTYNYIYYWCGLDRIGWFSLFSVRGVVVLIVSVCLFMYVLISATLLCDYVRCACIIHSCLTWWVVGFVLRRSVTVPFGGESVFMYVWNIFHV